jgi:aspartyl-tRNA(Asn)/glutamyl-tRNA(Gln) amidotransferase subunit C
MINTSDIKNLASLARIELTEAEAENMTKDVDSILGYVGKINDAVSNDEVKKQTPLLRNVMRDDSVTHTPGEFTEDILNNAPDREGNYLKVKKIL